MRTQARLSRSTAPISTSVFRIAASPPTRVPSKIAGDKWLHPTTAELWTSAVHFTANAFSDPYRPDVMLCIYNESAVFDWDENNLRKIRAHRIKPEDIEQALSNDPIPIYEQGVEGELR